MFIRHPRHDNWYKYCGRLDDTLVQVLGEKTNPGTSFMLLSFVHNLLTNRTLVPIELAIRGNSPFVAEAIVFGAGRPQVGCLVLPSDAGRQALEVRIKIIVDID